MSLITRIGASSANSFVTLDQADAIMPVVLPDDVSAWTALSTAQKEYRLVVAAQIMSYLALRGKKTYHNQALCFPRVMWNRDYGVWSSELDYEVDHHMAFRIPDEVKDAQCMIALSVVHRGLANRPEATEADAAAVTSVSLGGMLSVSFGSLDVGGSTSLDMIMSSTQSLVYFKLKRFLSQMRGRATSKVADDDYFAPKTALTSTTTTTTTATTTTTSTSSSSTTTTTAP